MNLQVYETLFFKEEVKHVSEKRKITPEPQGGEESLRPRLAPAP
jgi:hypothetical protein